MIQQQKYGHAQRPSLESLNRQSSANTHNYNGIKNAGFNKSVNYGNDKIIDRENVNFGNLTSLGYNVKNKNLVSTASIQAVQPKLIQFDDQDDDIQFHSDHGTQKYQQQPSNQLQNSVISTQTQKRKKQIREKVTQYLNTRKTMSNANNPNIASTQPNTSNSTSKKPNRLSNAYEEEQIIGDILDELLLIGMDEKKLDENEGFVLLFNKNPENAINQYLKKGIIYSDQPTCIAAYLAKVEGLDKQVLGEYFGKNNKRNMEVLHSFCKILNFKNVEFDIALRTLLSRFRLPGESQQIQRIVWQFSQAFYEINQQDYNNADQLFPLAYAIIMLATDAHNPQQQKKMKKQDFIKNTQGACPSIPHKYLQNIYNRIKVQKLQTQVSDVENMYARLRDVHLNANDFKSTLKLTNQLKKGDIFVKACRSKNKMVQRKLYLSDDQQRICWVSLNSQNQPNDEQPRFIQIKDIVDLTLGLGSIVMQKNRLPQQFDPMCFTIETVHRTLDLKAKTNKQRAKWLNFIRAALIKKRQVKIQQLQQNQNRNLRRDHLQQIWNTQIFPHWDRHWDYKNKKPLVRNVLVRGIQAICCCWRRTPKTSDGFQTKVSSHGLQIKTSKLETLWMLGLPDNSRKVLWPLVIGNNLALSSTMLQQIKKRTRRDQNLRKFVSFSQQTIQMGQVCRQFRPDIPAIRDLLLISQMFIKVFPKNNLSINPTNQNTALSAFLNLVHLDHFLSFYRGDKSQIDLRIQLFQFLLEKNSFKVKKHFQVLKLETRMYLVSWFLSAFADCFNHRKYNQSQQQDFQYQQFLFRIWDNFLLQGQIYLFKVGITIIKYYQIELKMCTFHEGLKILRFPKNISELLFFQILNNQIDVKQEYFHSYIDMRKHAIIKTKVQAIPLE